MDLKSIYKNLGLETSLYSEIEKYNNRLSLQGCYTEGETEEEAWEKWSRTLLSFMWKRGWRAMERF